MRGNILWMFLIVFLVVSTMAVVSVSTASPGPAVISVEPPTSTAEVGESFTVDINVTDVSNLYNWEFFMNFSSSVLNVTDVTEGPFLSDVGGTSWTLSPPVIDNFAGTVMAYNLLWFFPAEGASGTGTLCTITFQVKDVGNTPLHFMRTPPYYTMLSTWNGTDLALIEHTAEDGYFSNVHDVAITEVTASPNSVAVGESVSIDVTVANEGDFPETSNITVYWKIGDIYDVIETREGESLQNRTSKTLSPSFTWTPDASGTYTIHANATVLESLHNPQGIDNNQTNNTFEDGVVEVIGVVANFTASSLTPLRDEMVSFDASASYDPDGGDIESYEWNFGDGTPVVTVTSPITNHTYTEPGEYPVVLTVNDTDGERGFSQPKLITVRGYPVAVFTYSSEPEAPLVLTFNASTSTPEGGSIVSYSWDFGDGSNGTGETVTHTYAETGNYTVTLNVTDSEGLANSTTQTVTIPKKHDVAVVSVEIPPLQESVWAGEGVSITIDVENWGTETETFNVTTYYDDHIIETRLVTNLTSGASQQLDVPWGTIDVPAGEYNITAEAVLVGELVENLANNKDTTQISVDVADIAITNVIASPSTVLAGDLLNITVVVKNEGASNIGSFLIEIFFTNTTHSNMAITDFSIGGLTSGTENSEWGTWNATKAGISPGTYMLSAKVDRIKYGATDAEFDTDDNVFPRGDIPPINVTVGASLISISANPETITVGSSTTINGTITPVRPSVNVTIQYRLSGNETWNTLETVTTNENGTYSYTWKPETVGTYEVKASWEGDNDTLPGESEPLAITVNQVQPNVFLYVLAAVAIIAIAATAIYLLKFRKPKPK